MDSTKPDLANDCRTLPSNSAGMLYWSEISFAVISAGERVFAMCRMAINPYSTFLLSINMTNPTYLVPFIGRKNGAFSANC